MTVEAVASPVGRADRRAAVAAFAAAFWDYSESCHLLPDERRRRHVLPLAGVTASYQPTPTWPLVWAMWRDPC